MISSPKTDPVRILIVEDNEEDFKLISLLLSRPRLKEVYSLDWASSFDEGLARLRTGRYEAGLFDYNLGGRSGLELLRDAIGSGIEMPIILLTGMEDPRVDEEALRVGAADYVSKFGLNSVQLERSIRYARRHFAIQSELRRTSQLLNGVLSSLPVIAGRLDANGTVIEAHGRGLGAMGLAEEALVGANALEAWPAYAEEIRTALGGGGSEFTCEVERNGATHYFDNYLRFDATHGQGAIGFSVNVTSRVVAENERRRHAHLLRSIMRNLPVVAGRIRSDGVIMEVEGDGLARYGLGSSQLTGRTLWELFPQSRKAVLDALAGGSASFVLGDGHSGDEWSVDFFVSFDTLRGDGAMFLGRDLTERRRLERQLLTVTDAEQQRIGADLHDGLGQELTGLACLAAAMRDRLKASQPKEAAQAELIARLANEATVKSRALAHGLSPVQLEVHGLPSALEDLVYQCQRLHSIECTFVLRGEPPAIDHLAAIHLYRIAQEAIHNAVRHGEAQHVRVAIVSRPSRHRLVILDDGKGFDQRGSNTGNGRGLNLMNYRANMLGGSITVWSEPAQGTRVYCDWNRSAAHSHSDSHSHEDRNNRLPSPDRSVA